MYFFVTTHSEGQTHEVGRALGALLRPGDFVSLDGELGAGKTRLVRGIVEGAGLCGAAVSSPTYVIAQEYNEPALHSRQAGDATPHRQSPDVATRIVHVDAYRLRGVDELESIGWDALVVPGAAQDHRPIVLIEWAERIAAALPVDEGRCIVRLWHGGHEGVEATNRTIELRVPDTWAARAQWAGAEQVLRDLRSQNDTLTAAQPGTPISPEAGAICPITGKSVPPNSPTFPFADERARLADLSRWLSGAYTLERAITPDDVEEGEAGSL